MYLFLKAHNFPRATLSENCSLIGTNNIRGQICELIFVPNGGYCLYNCVLLLPGIVWKRWKDYWKRRPLHWDSNLESIFWVLESRSWDPYVITLDNTYHRHTGKSRYLVDMAKQLRPVQVHINEFLKTAIINNPLHVSGDLLMIVKDWVDWIKWSNNRPRLDSISLYFWCQFPRQEHKGKNDQGV